MRRQALNKINDGESFKDFCDKIVSICRVAKCRP